MNMYEKKRLVETTVEDLMTVFAQNLLNEDGDTKVKETILVLLEEHDWSEFNKDIMAKMKTIEERKEFHKKLMGEIYPKTKKTVKVVSVNTELIKFDDGTKLYGHHDMDGYGHHYLDLEHITLDDFDGLEFDLSGDNFFERVPQYGIKLVPVRGGWPVSIPGYGDNNGYYSDNLSLVVESPDGTKKVYDITECQDY